MKNACSCFSAAGWGAVGALPVSRNAINKGNKVDLNHIINEIRDDRMALVQHTVYDICSTFFWTIAHAFPSYSHHPPAVCCVLLGTQA